MTGAPAARRRRLRLSRQGLVVAAAVVGLAAPLATYATVQTSASYEDYANLNAETNGIGNPETFDIALVRDGVLRQADGDGLAWAVDGTAELVPGRVLTTQIPVVNNGPYPATVRMSVEDLLDEASTGAIDVLPLLRWTVVDADTGQVLAGDAADPLASTVDTAALGSTVAPFALAARGSAQLADGDAWVAGAAGSARTLTVHIAYPDTAGTEAYNGGTARLRVAFDAESS